MARAVSEELYGPHYVTTEYTQPAPMAATTVHVTSSHRQPVGTHPHQPVAPPPYKPAAVSPNHHTVPSSKAVVSDYIML